jgi:hypothetical protein
MAYTSIDDPSEYFQVKTYSGTGSAQSITNDGNSNLQPDWMITKNRTGTTDPMVNDSSRGVTKYLFANRANAEATSTVDITSFDSDGFSVATGESVNDSGDTFVAWQWKANGGTTSSNTDGSITSTVQANTDAGFSIVTFTGTGSTATVGHGLGAIPAMIIQKNRDSSANWSVKHQRTANNYDFLNLNLSSAATANDSIWTQTDPTTSVFSIGTASAINQSGQDQVCYCFAEKQGYSNFGKYIGNSSVNGPFVYTGFKPRWIIQKNATTAATSWFIYDSVRDPGNPLSARLAANATDAETSATYSPFDFYSNGFRLRDGTDIWNENGSLHIYMAFAENPFVTSTGIPTTAR